jgi:hypothetical protein
VAKGGRFAELARAQFMVEPNMAQKTARGAHAQDMTGTAVKI